MHCTDRQTSTQSVVCSSGVCRAQILTLTADHRLITLQTTDLVKKVIMRFHKVPTTNILVNLVSEKEYFFYYKKSTFPKAMQCNAIQCITIKCNAMQCSAMHYEKRGTYF